MSSNQLVQRPTGSEGSGFLIHLIQQLEDENAMLLKANTQLYQRANVAEAQLKAAIAEIEAEKQAAKSRFRWLVACGASVLLVVVMVIACEWIWRAL
jgi:hypothetical protein